MARVLVVDDNESLRQTAVDSLEFFGHTCVSAKDGQEALEILAQQQFDLILTDYEMPRMDGPEFCRQVLAKNSKQPIIIITGKYFLLHSELEKLVNQGVRMAMSKPYKLEEFGDAITRVLQL